MNIAEAPTHLTPGSWVRVHLVPLPMFPAVEPGLRDFIQNGVVLPFYPGDFGSFSVVYAWSRVPREASVIVELAEQGV